MKFLHNIPEQFFCAESKEIIVGADRKKLWAVLLDMLLALDDVCKRHQIKYYLDSGSLLGAVRHGGFIPWDDDLDVVMLREDYDRLCQVADKEFSHPFFFQTEYTDYGSARGHAQLRRSDTTGILKSEMISSRPLYSFNQGIFLDIFPLDAVPDEEAELGKFKRLLVSDKDRIAKLKRLLCRRFLDPIRPWHPRSVLSAVLSCWYRLVKRVLGYDALDRAYRKLDRDVCKYNGKGMRRVANFCLNPLRKASQLFDREIYENQALYDFEGFKFPGPKNFERVLSGHYGDWHAHVVGGAVHGGMLIDLDKPYTEYLKK